MPPKPAAPSAPKTPAAPAKEDKPEDPNPAVPTEDDGVVKHGVFSFADGAMYTGEYRSVGGVLQRHGHGVYQYGPEKYEGQWEADAMHGKGVYHFATGAVYEGEFQGNVFHGDGRYEWADGASYVGAWRLGRMHSELATYTDKDGVAWRGRFFNGKFDNGRIFHALR